MSQPEISCEPGGRTAAEIHVPVGKCIMGVGRPRGMCSAQTLYIHPSNSDQNDKPMSLEQIPRVRRRKLCTMSCDSKDALENHRTQA